MMVTLSIRWLSFAFLLLGTVSIAQGFLLKSAKVTFLPLQAKKQKISTSHQGDRWQRHFDELVRYKEEHGDCNVKEDSSFLAEWLQEQQKQYHLLMQHKKVRLTRKRAHALESIGAIVEERIVQVALQQESQDDDSTKDEKDKERHVASVKNK
jgi:hypothetical protein